MQIKAAGRLVKVSASGVGGNGSEPNKSEIDLARNFLAGCAATKSATVSSYWLKHRIEEKCGMYIANGAAIVAASQLGLKIVFTNSLNAKIGISKKGLV